MFQERRNGPTRRDNGDQSGAPPLPSNVTAPSISGGACHAWSFLLRLCSGRPAYLIGDLQDPSLEFNASNSDRSYRVMSGEETIEYNPWKAVRSIQLRLVEVFIPAPYFPSSCTSMPFDR